MSISTAIKAFSNFARKCMEVGGDIIGNRLVYRTADECGILYVVENCLMMVFLCVIIW